MTAWSFTNGHVVTAGGVLPAARITLAGDRIAAISEAPGPDAIDLAGGWIMPGFIDTQVNGGGGVLFNDAPTIAGIAAIGEAHAPTGTTGFLPTLITDAPAVIGRALDAVDAAIAAGVPGVLGIHVEGPVINPARHGIHDEARVHPLDDALMALLLRPRRGVVMVTLAPERVPADRIRALAAAGVRVSLGHSDASHAEAVAGIAAGITGVTHLFNAMSPMAHRAPGVVGAALDDPRLYCGIIADGHHVDDVVLRVALRSRPRDRFMLVTDAMPCVGAAEKDFTLQGKRIRVVDGRCVDAAGTLAGSDLDMAGAVRHAITRLGVAPEEAAVMAAGAPAAFLGLADSHGQLAPGRRADWVRLDAGFHPVETMIAGTRRVAVA
ncbi:N-acetylglucosamine-6-phosphate deacetylase [Sphingomonas morindae]|uniref:N-acetylglucosamine-6-phosphate deacetylase n=1 Tax=Sphingomonas morindae TaxID=1541170 RepID=A0ABY4X754_9SPHN|nr:N-acetylglucosamine-6-phosphate deacetylase [Sphingomonas morindae]USI72736.1 N-acetylglucosamine-6-phosphate deacetylase [Sphingomonas morindae]